MEEMRISCEGLKCSFRYSFDLNKIVSCLSRKDSPYTTETKECFMGKVKGGPFTFSQKPAALYDVMNRRVSNTYLLDVVTITLESLPENMYPRCLPYCLRSQAVSIQCR